MAEEQRSSGVEEVQSNAPSSDQASGHIVVDYPFDVLQEGSAMIWLPPVYLKILRMRCCSPIGNTVEQGFAIDIH